MQRTVALLNYTAVVAAASLLAAAASSNDICKQRTAALQQLKQQSHELQLYLKHAGVEHMV
jgi:hypothetical protein